MMLERISIQTERRSIRATLLGGVTKSGPATAPNICEGRETPSDSALKIPKISGPRIAGASKFDAVSGDTHELAAGRGSGSGN
jgi:hypothetical protein